MMKLTKLTLTLITSMLVFFSCQKDANDKLANVIPADAVYVVNVDMKSLTQKSDYNIFDNITVSRLINLGKAYVGKEEALKLLDTFTKDVNSLGINLKGDSYFYTDYTTYGLVLGMNDAQKFKKSLLDFSVIKEGDVKEENGIQILPISKYAVVSWNNDVLVVLGHLNSYAYYASKDDLPSLEDLAKKYLTQDKAQSILSNPSFATFMKEKKDISFFQSYSSLNFLEKMQGAGLPEAIAKEFEALRGAASLAFISFETGEVKVSNKVCFDNPDLEKKYKELIGNLTGTLSGDQLKYMIEKPVFMASANLKGDGIYGYLDKLGLAKEMERSVSTVDSTLTAKSIFEHFNGDVSFAFNALTTVKKSYSYSSGEVYEYDSIEPFLALFADVKDGKQLLDVLVKQVSQVKELTKVTETAYIYEDSGMKVYLGLTADAKTLYCTNDESVMAKVNNASGLKNNFADLTKGNTFVVSGDLVALKSIIEEKTKEDERIQSIFLEAFSLFGSYEYTTTGDFSGKGKWVINDKSKNSFAVICNFVDKTLTRFNEEINDRLF